MFTLSTALVACATLVAVDGDTINCDGVRMRLLGDGEPFVSGFDTPEITKAKCPAEKLLGQKAKVRLQEILRTPGIKIEGSGETEDRHGRPLVRIRLPDGRTAGSIMLAEGLARAFAHDVQANWAS
jgi:endonuclease YncB( thermonuclease family)